MKNIAVLFISNQISDETTSRASVLNDCCNAISTDECKYKIYWVYDKDDEYWHITSSSTGVNFFICTQKQLKNKYRRIFYNWNCNFNVILYTMAFQELFQYDYVWSIEDDVICRNNRWDCVFKGFEDCKSDLLGTHITFYNEAFFNKIGHLDVSFENEWEFDYYKTCDLYNIKTWVSAFLPVLRLSKEASNFLIDYYTQYNGFFEIIIPTLLYNNGFKIEDISSPYSEFTNKENYNKYYLIQSYNYKVDSNNNYGTMSYTDKFIGKITDIPDGILMHPMKWWNTNIFEQEKIILKNTDDKYSLVHYICYNNEEQLEEYKINDLPKYLPNVKLYNTNSEYDKFNLNNLNPYICEYSMFYWIWKYDIKSKYVSTNQYKRIFNIEELDYNKIDTDTCTIHSFMKFPKEIILNQNAFGLHNWASKGWMNCEWLYNDYIDYVNNKYGINNSFILEDGILEEKRFFIQYSCFIMSRKHFHNLCDYIFGFLFYIDDKYNLDLDPSKYNEFIINKFILPNKGKKLKGYNTIINEDNKDAYRILSLMFEWMASIYITSTFNKIYYRTDN